MIKIEKQKITHNLLLKKISGKGSVKWTEKGEIFVWNVPAMLFPINTFVFLQKTLELKYGDDAKHILYQLGKLQAKMGTEIMIDKFGFKRDKQTFEFTNQQTQLIGNGVLEFIKCDFKNKYFLLKNFHVPFARHYLRTYGLQKEPVDHFIRGTIAGGTIPYVQDESMVVIEKQCIAMGKPYCIFEVKQADKWDLKDKLVKSQFPEDTIDLKKLGKHLGLRGLIRPQI